MKRISNKANLSRSYTNHCVRATAVQKLVDAGVSETAIMGTTGHRQVQSLTAYANRNSEQKRKEMAAVLDGESPTATNAATRALTAPTTSVQRSQQQTEFHDPDIDEYIATCDPTVQSPTHQRSLMQKATKTINFSGAQFGANCNVHLHL